MKLDQVMEEIISAKRQLDILQHMVETHQLVMHYLLREHGAGRDLTPAIKIVAVMKAQLDEIIGDFPEAVVDQAISELSDHMAGKH